MGHCLGDIVQHLEICESFKLVMNVCCQKGSESRGLLSALFVLSSQLSLGFLEPLINDVFFPCRLIDRI